MTRALSHARKILAALAVVALVSAYTFSPTVAHADWAFGAGTVGKSSNSVSLNITSPTVSGDNTLGVVQLVFVQGRSITAATWNGSNLTQVDCNNSVAPANCVYYIINPTAGATTISFTMSGGTSGATMSAAADFFTGIKQTSPFGCTGKNAGGLSASCTTEAANSLFYAAYAGYSAYNDANQAAGDGLTESLFQNTSGSSQEHHQETGYKDTTTAGSYTGSWGNNGGINQQIIVAEFKEAVAGGDNGAVMMMSMALFTFPLIGKKREDEE